MGGRCQLQLSSDVSWQLAKDADGPDGKVKNKKNLDSWNMYVDKKIGNLGQLKKIQNGHKESNHKTILRHGKNAKQYLDNPIYRF